MENNDEREIPMGVDSALRYLIFALQENERRLIKRMDRMQEDIDRLTMRIGKMDIFDDDYEAALQKHLDHLIAESEPENLKQARKLLPGALTVKEAASELHVTVKTIYNYIDRGLLQTERVANRRMITKESFEAMKDTIRKD